MLYSILHRISPLLLRVLFRLRVKGIENIPSNGGFILCSNHLSNLDPVILGTALPRPAYYVAKDSLFRNPIFARVITILHAIPIQEKGLFRKTFKRAEELLLRGEALLIYPEGTRSKDGSLGRAKGGVGMLVSTLREIPVIPARIIGSNRALPPGALFIRPYQIEVRFGRPIHFEIPSSPSRATYQEIANTIMAAIGKL